MRRTLATFATIIISLTLIFLTLDTFHRSTIKRIEKTKLSEVSKIKISPYSFPVREDGAFQVAISRIE